MGEYIPETFARKADPRKNPDFQRTSPLSRYKNALSAIQGYRDKISNKNSEIENPEVNDNIYGSGIPAATPLPARERSFMDTPGAFTGPNNDPTTPGMTREWVKEPELTAFHPDDARYAQRQAQIAAKESASQANLRDAIAAREQSDSGLKREVFEETRRNNKEDRQIAAEDRLRRRNREDSEMAWRADFEAAKAAWSEAHGGQPWSPEAQAKQEARDYEQSVAVDHEASIRYLNALETDVNNDLDAVEQGGVPSSPDTIKVIQEITGKPFGQVALDRATLERIRTLLGGNLQREREMATEKMQSLLKILKVNKSEKESEF